MNQDILFNKLLLAKAPWEVTNTTMSPVKEGAKETIIRCLCLRGLELPVGEWISEASKREQENLGEQGTALLLSNIEDEDRHDKQLTNAWNAYKNMVSNTQDLVDQAPTILNRWLAMGNKYHPALVAFVAEAGVFIPMLTFFRRCGGVAMANIANDISRDEAIHLRAHREVSMTIAGQTINEDLDQLRKDTLDWIFYNLEVDEKVTGKFGKKQIYLDNSQSLVYNGVAKGFAETSKSTQIAFFEVAGNNIPVYGSSK